MKLKDKKKESSINNDKIVLGAFILAYIVDFVFLVVRFIDKKDLYFCSTEIGLLLIITIILSVFMMLTKEDKNAKTVFGQKITKSTKKSKRVLHYLFESLYFSMILTTIIAILIVSNKLFIDFYGIMENNVILSIILTLLGIFIGLSIIVFLIEYFVREKMLNKKN